MERAGEKKFVPFTELQPELLYTILKITPKNDNFVAELDDVKIMFPKNIYNGSFIAYTGRSIKFFKPTYYHCFCECSCDFCNCIDEQLKDYCPCVVFNKIKVRNMDNYATKIEWCTNYIREQPDKRVFKK